VSRLAPPGLGGPFGVAAQKLQLLLARGAVLGGQGKAEARATGRSFPGSALVAGSQVLSLASALLNLVGLGAPCVREAS